MFHFTVWRIPDRFKPHQTKEHLYQYTKKCRKKAIAYLVKTLKYHISNRFLCRKDVLYLLFLGPFQRIDVFQQWLPIQKVWCNPDWPYARRPKAALAGIQKTFQLLYNPLGRTTSGRADGMMA
jgi:hypothetical protein